MGKEILAVPEEDLDVVIDFIRNGIRDTLIYLKVQDSLTPEKKRNLRIAEQLKRWCDQVEGWNEKE